MRGDIQFDPKLIMEILDRGFNCRAKDKGKAMILAEIWENWPGERRQLDEDGNRPERRVKERGLPEERRTGGRG